ncbi:hypothetical protein TKK_0018819 [Trichogramma kaykai]|uniref:tRNA-specific adenosine deaminase 1 n=1 Tax=Trichogramma kaykai TaxID=54128 RepID=A0ABD2VW38_9HYME
MDFKDKIAQLCLEKYSNLKKTGKPTEKEWTILSGVVLEDNLNNFKVVSLCTGTKCLSGKELKNTEYCNLGNKLNDSHAEILTRRAFIRYLYHQILIAINEDKSEIFYLKERKIEMKDVNFHFFSSQTPCGDCSIIPKSKIDVSQSPPKKMRKSDKGSFEQEYGQEVEDIHRTGAKCIENGEQDKHGQGVDFHTVGPLRTKPGRGDRTLSLSCSDKMSKWNIMGVQGALLTLLIKPIHFKSIIIGGGCPYSLDSMERGLFKRFDPNTKAPVIKQSLMAFEHSKDGIRLRPCPSSIVWCDVPEKSLEISVNGLKQGATKNKKNTNLLRISRKELFKTFLGVYDQYSNSTEIAQHPKKMKYYQCKQYCVSYQNKWKSKEHIYPLWPAKPLHLKECLSF